MSLVSGIRGFSVSMYGQSGVVMDWFGLADPFGQQIPLKITNTYSGTLWFQSQLVNPRSGYYNYSGVQLGSVGSGASATLVATWDAGVSGWITGSSPITDTLTLNLTTFTSSNYTGSYSSGNFTVFNTLFNRYSGVIKVFGDIYSNDQPATSLTPVTGGTLSGAYQYAISYNLSGWESDIGAPTSITLSSGFNTVSVSWGTVTGASQFFLWRWSGTVDFSLYSGASAGFGTLLPIDLIAVSGSSFTSFNDTGVAALQSRLFRHRNWQQTNFTLPTSDTAVFLDGPASRNISPTVTYFAAHGYQLNKNLSGTNLLGPFYGVFHFRHRSALSGLVVALQNSIDGLASGTTIVDGGASVNELQNVWYRQAIQLGGSGTLSASGTVHIQLFHLLTYNVDSVFVVAVS